MPLTLYEITIPPFIHCLKALSAILEKSRLYVPANEASLLSSRLIADMAALPFQIQRISDTAKGLAVRLGKAEPVVMPDTETTFPELQARIAKTIALLEKLDPKCMDGMEDVEVVLRTQGLDRKFTGRSYVQTFAVPNFYFHLCMAYAILRKEGVPLGKLDYFGVA
jgi:uncharacterized protein